MRLFLGPCQIFARCREYSNEAEIEWKGGAGVEDPIVTAMLRSPEQGLELLMDRYMGLVYTIVSNQLRQVCSKEDIEDCASEVLFAVYQQRAAIDLSRSSLKTFVAVVAKRKAITRYHKLRSEQLQVEQYDSMHMEGIADSHKHGAELAGEKEMKQELINAIKSLGEPDSQILVRKYYLGQSSKEIAAQLNMKVNTLDKRVSRALGRLKHLIGREGF